MALDLADQADREKLAEAADGFDYLVNSHGIIKIKPIFEVSVEDWRAVQGVNAESVFFLCQRIGPRLRPGGAIVNLSSSSAKLASTIEVAPYAASKTTILSITRSFAYALASRPVRVNAICPGIIDTPMQDNVLEGVSRLRHTGVAALEEARNRMVPLGRAASAAECAGGIWFLLSDDSAYMTGQAVNFTGGLVTW
jgi:NAD(P)-dependent dehydrogenase (short-subunit alcohol dehydrogenase family)